MFLRKKEGAGGTLFIHYILEELLGKESLQGKAQVAGIQGGNGLMHQLHPLFGGLVTVLAGSQVMAGRELASAEDLGKMPGHAEHQRIRCHCEEIIRIGTQQLLHILRSQFMQVAAEA